jgi:hypothetical protein
MMHDSLAHDTICRFTATGKRAGRHRDCSDCGAETLWEYCAAKGRWHADHRHILSLIPCALDL